MICMKKKLSIHDMEAIAVLKNGECLSSVYCNAHKKLWWKCANGHEFKMTYANVSQNHWCPICCGSYSEDFCRFILESATRLKFPKNKRVLCGLELDGYCKTMNLAFEYQGRQHYQYIAHWHKDKDTFKKQQDRDFAKRVLCEEKGIRLLVISYTTKNLVSHIINLLRKIGIKTFPVDETKFKSPVYYKLEELYEIARTHGGKCLSTKYLGNNYKLEWECQHGHTWWTTPSSIKHRNSWCGKCLGLSKGTIEEMREIAKMHGGECLSNVYINCETKLQWKCSEGHTWYTKPLVIKQRHWCRRCSQKNRRE